MLFCSSSSFDIEELEQEHLKFIVWNTALRPRHHTITFDVKKMFRYKLQSGSGGHHLISYSIANMAS